MGKCYNQAMIPVAIIVILCWGIFLVYWVINSFSTKPTQERAWNVSNFRWVVLAVVSLLIILGYLGWFFSVHIPSCEITWQGCHYTLGDLFGTRSVPEQIVSIIMIIAGLIIAVAARKALSDNWSGNIEIKKGHELITNGMYGYVRHPIYAGVMLMVIGTLFFAQTVLALIFFSAILVFFILKLTQEEKLLIRHFPKEYSQYKKRTKALIPFVV